MGALCCCCSRRSDETGNEGVSSPLLAGVDRENTYSGSQAGYTGYKSSATDSRSGGATREGSRVKRKLGRRSRRRARPSPEATAATNFVLQRKAYEWVEPLPAMGCRLQKSWAHLRPAALGSAVNVYEDLLLCVMPLSSSCLLQLEDTHTLRKLNELMEQLRKHPYIQPVLEIEYLRDTNHVAVIQPYLKQGSLKDLIAKCSPDEEWDRKYRKMKSLPPEQIARYGRHILEALLFLYDLPKKKDKKTIRKKLQPSAKVNGFSPLGHVHSGNVFVESDVCKLGGYENALLAYKTRHGKLFKGHTAHIDVLMFGHLVFEMACGYELVTALPTAEDLHGIKHREVCKVLEFIFDQRKSGDFPTIEEVRYHRFFNKDELVRDLQYGSSQVAVSNGMLKLLERTQYLVHDL